MTTATRRRPSVASRGHRARHDWPTVTSLRELIRRAKAGEKDPDRQPNSPQFCLNEDGTGSPDISALQKLLKQLLG